MSGNLGKAEPAVDETRSVVLAADADYTVPFVGDVFLRVYADSRPRNLEIGRLQKGLVLVRAGRELIEEGIGFGVPVVMFSDKTYFSESAQVSVREKGAGLEIVKSFCMDAVSKKGFRNGVFVDNVLYRFVSGSLASVYRDYPAARRIVFPLIKMRNRVGVRTYFTSAKPRGEVTVTYTIKQSGIDVAADFTRLDKRNCEKLLLANEQGSTFFRRFSDSGGLNLVGNQIGAWDGVRAEWACFSDVDNTLGFCLENLPNSKLFRGTEYVRGRLAWAGMGYELKPTLDLFRYTIRISGKDVAHA